MIIRAQDAAVVLDSNGAVGKRIGCDQTHTQVTPTNELAQNIYSSL